MNPEIAQAKPASTVVLVRDGAEGIEVFLQRRVKQMAFAGGMTVFPGGGVDPRDGDADIAWEGPEVGWWADRFNTDPQLAQKLVCTAVRETFEECGVLLAAATDGSAPDVAALMPQRGLLEDRTLSLAQFLANNELVLRADLLRPLAHWITPKNEGKRYDTRFFVAAMPAGQHADDRTSEVDEARWQSVEQALADWTAGRAFLLPPTWSQLKEVARYDDVAALLAAEHSIGPVEPTVSSTGKFTGMEFSHADDYFATMNRDAYRKFSGVQVS